MKRLDIDELPFEEQSRLSSFSPLAITDLVQHSNFVTSTEFINDTALNLPNIDNFIPTAESVFDPGTITSMINHGSVDEQTPIFGGLPTRDLTEANSDSTRGVSGSPFSGNGREKPPLRQNSTYIHTTLDEFDIAKSANAQQAIKLTSEAAMEFVMLFESQNGRVPRDMNIEHPNYPGSDIESTSPDGSVRRIEVKGLSGIWRDYDVELTLNQFGDAWQHGQDAWLYVVEHARTSPKLYRICNFTKHKDNRFLFNSRWKLQAEGAKGVDPKGRQPTKGMRIKDTSGRIGIIIELAFVNEFNLYEIIIHWENSTETTNTMWNTVEYKILE